MLIMRTSLGTTDQSRARRWPSLVSVTRVQQVIDAFDESLLETVLKFKKTVNDLGRVEVDDSLRKYFETLSQKDWRLRIYI